MQYPQSFSAKDLAAAVSLLEAADGLLITAGAGMGVDSGLPDFRGPEGFWRAYPHLKSRQIAFEDVANPAAFYYSPKLAWGFYGHRLNLYRKTQPHPGFDILLSLCQRMKNGYFVYTSNVDGQFQKAGFSASSIVECHGSIHWMQCGMPCSPDIERADRLRPEVDPYNGEWIGHLPRCQICRDFMRPNILMFNDWKWLDTVAHRQEIRKRRWLSGVENLVIIEIGAGKEICTVRYQGEGLGAPIIRINPRDCQKPHRGISLRATALEALQALNAVMNGKHD